MIKEYIESKYSFKNLSKYPTANKVKVIKDALKHFEII